jgi:hypothetical protein
LFLPLRGEQTEDIVLLGEAALIVFREDDAAVGDDVELAALALDGRRLMPSCAGDRGRETRGPGVVPVSDWAVANLDCHARSIAG